MVSIIMPVYNSEKYIAEAIESVCNQSYKNWELLIVNDGSTDRSPDIINEYAEKDDRIKVFHKKNSGVSSARNIALSYVRGELVTFIDSDDVYHPNRLEKMVNVFEMYPTCDFVFSKYREFKGNLELVDENSNADVVLSDENILKRIISDSRYHFVCNSMIKSKIAKKERFAPIRFAEDFCFIRDCACHCKQMAVLDDVLYYYRRDNENAMTSHFFSEKYVKDYMMLVEYTYAFCKELRLNDDFFKKMVAHEYAQNCMRIRKSTSYSTFVSCMNNMEFRAGIDFAEVKKCTLFEKIIFTLVKYKIYMPFAFWIW